VFKCASDLITNLLIPLHQQSCSLIRTNAVKVLGACGFSASNLHRNTVLIAASDKMGTLAGILAGQSSSAALILADGQTITRDQLNKMIADVAARLQAAGIGKDDVVSIAMTNTVLALRLLHAILVHMLTFSHASVDRLCCHVPGCYLGTRGRGTAELRLQSGGYHIHHAWHGHGHRLILKVCRRRSSSSILRMPSRSCLLCLLKATQLAKPQQLPSGCPLPPWTWSKELVLSTCHACHELVHATLE
jgi:hypothetical protein